MIDSSFRLVEAPEWDNPDKYSSDGYYVAYATVHAIPFSSSFSTSFESYSYSSYNKFSSSKIVFAKKKYLYNKVTLEENFVMNFNDLKLNKTINDVFKKTNQFYVEERASLQKRYDKAKKTVSFYSRSLNTARAMGRPTGGVRSSLNNAKAKANAIYAESETLSNEFKSDVGSVGEAMLAVGMSCEEVYEYLIDIYGDVLSGTKEDFLSHCELVKKEVEELKEKNKIETDCCLLVCCEPDKYKMKGEDSNDDDSDSKSGVIEWSV